MTQDTSDIDPDGRVDVAELDACVNTCVASATGTLQRQCPQGFSPEETSHLRWAVEGLRSSHESIRMLLRSGITPSSVDALVIARLQLETVYNVCFFLQDPCNIQLYVKNGWKRQFVRYLLSKEEFGHLPRAQTYYAHEGAQRLESLRLVSFVSKEERDWLQAQELGSDTVGLVEAPIAEFPTPGRLMRKMIDARRLAVLKRLYPEYQWLCTFAHGGSTSGFFRTISDDRHPTRNAIEPWKRWDVNQKEVAEAAINYSTLSCVCTATEIYSAFPGDVELARSLTKAWTLLQEVHLLHRVLWTMSTKGLLGAL
jgi:hypothetical protein